jgi:predicted phage terminase large subunit-like protein
MRSNAESQSVCRATCNPEPKESEGGWLHEFLQGFYLDDYGYPIPENSGKIRWFISDDDGHLAWGDSREELQAKYGLDCDPMSFTFISANIKDNLVLCRLQPSYLTALKNLGRVERERLLYGGWNVSPQGSGYFKREWVDFVEHKDVPKMKKVIRAYDLAASIKSEINSDPDSTACVKIGIGEDGYIYVLNAKEILARPAGVAKLIQDTAEYDGRNVPISLPQDAAAGGLIQFEHYAKPLILAGYKVKRSKTRKGKLERFSGFSNAAENGMVRIVKGDWNDKYISQLENFDPERRRQHDDFVDCTSDGYNWLISGKKLPEKFTLPSLTKMNEFASRMF